MYSCTGESLEARKTWKHHWKSEKIDLFSSFILAEALQSRGVS